MEFIGYIALIIMGITLGLVGAGGSILTIPILVYFFDNPIILATSYSLIIVGFSSFIAAICYRRHIFFKKAVIFIIPSVLGVFLARYFIISNLPTSLGNFSIDKAFIALLLTFMGIAGYFMIKISTFQYDKVINLSFSNNIKISLMSLSLGIIIGTLGAGGGFLIIPTIVIFMGFAMQEAVATSLFIITINSFTGFVSDRHHLLTSDWINLSKYLGCALIGMCVGVYCTKFIQMENLKKIFGYFIWIIGTLIFVKEFIL